ncbi:putative mediator of RNA polymerase II transcription subunit 26 isoform X2 [Condylostylus longicornis]|uniref:putative mediator of RNA polymerase II transcription subunit 26 isoform X2 n=1 Tax=Condylostylus longicornis TaxID=2530218 RepID=UPI00244DCD6D|nr:putative mediator of RNA polymerase II transcription subunit 26 isoform X2 [Condylostylus longicornis]
MAATSAGSTTDQHKQFMQRQRQEITAKNCFKNLISTQSLSVATEVAAGIMAPTSTSQTINNGTPTLVLESQQQLRLQEHISQQSQQQQHIQYQQIPSNTVVLQQNQLMHQQLQLQQQRQQQNVQEQLQLSVQVQQIQQQQHLQQLQPQQQQLQPHQPKQQQTQQKQQEAQHLLYLEQQRHQQEQQQQQEQQNQERQQQQHQRQHPQHQQQQEQQQYQQTQQQQQQQTQQQQQQRKHQQQLQQQHQLFPRAGNIMNIHQQQINQSEQIRIIENNNVSSNVCSINSILTNNVAIKQISSSNNTLVSDSLPIVVTSAMAGPKTHNQFSADIPQQQQNSQSLLNQLNSIIPKQQQQQIISNLSANLAPGWRRLISSAEVVYVSPTGASFRTHQQIKDYLLAPGTCKCGLPCPLRPEYFFDFNSQVPNTLSKSPVENGLQSSRTSFSSAMCAHQRKLFDNQKILFQKDPNNKKRKMVDMPANNNSIKISIPSAQCSSVALYSNGNVMQTSQLVTGQQQQETRRLQIMEQQATQSHQSVGEILETNDTSNDQQNKQITNQQQDSVIKSENTIGNKQIGGVTLSKTPPWRKNSVAQQQKQRSQSQQISEIENVASQNQTLYLSTSSTTTLNTNNESVSTVSQQNSTPPWHDNSLALKNNSTATTLSSNSKKKAPPNFKDDPTGYMNQQTAILHNSIMNVVQSSDLNDDIASASFQNRQLTQDLSQANKVDKNPTINSNRESVMNKQNQSNVYINSSSLQSENTIDPSKTNISTSISQNFVEQNKKTSGQSIGTSQQIRKNYSDDSPGKIMSQLKQIVNHTGQQTNSSSSRVFNKMLAKTAVGNIANQNTVGNQIVAHYPSVMVQVERSCNNSSPGQQNIGNNNVTKINMINKTNQQIIQQNSEQRQQQTVQIQPVQQLQIHKQQTHIGQSQSLSAINNQSNHSFVLKPTQQKIFSTGGKQIIEYTEYVDDLQKVQSSNAQQIIILQSSQESPVSSSSAGIISSLNRLTPDTKFSVPSSSISPAPSNSSTSSSISTIIDKGPPQVGAVSTSHESPRHVESPEFSLLPSNKRISSASSSPMSSNRASSSPTIVQIQKSFAPTTSTVSRNTITSVQAGKTQTTTTTAISSTINKINGEQQSQKLSPSGLISATSLQLNQAVNQEPGNQLIMTSTGQIIVMPSSPSKPQKNTSSGSQIIINNSLTNVTPNAAVSAPSLRQQNLVIAQSSPNVMQPQQISPPSHATNSTSLVIQNSNLSQHSQNLLQSPSNLLASPSSQTTTNFIMNSSPQQVILNNGNIIHQSTGQNIITSQSNSGTSTNLIANSGGAAKIISSPTVLTSAGQVISNPASIISPNNAPIIGQQHQQVVVNTLPSGSYVIQHQPNTVQQAGYTTMDGQVVSIQDNGTATFVQQSQPAQQRHIIITSPDTSRRKSKKRKGNSTNSSPNTISSLSPQQSPTTIIQQPQVVQISAPQQYPTQQFQISPSIQQIVVNKPAQPTTTPQQQIFIQNGQILQPVNVIGQQLLVPAGANLLGQQLLVPADPTVLQIQNMGMSGSIITTPQGVVLRAPSPQNKQFLSPTGTGQQFLVNSNGQMSPISQIYSAPMSLMVPNSAGTTATFVQQSPTTSIVQQQPRGEIDLQPQLTQQQQTPHLQQLQSQQQPVVTSQITLNQNQNVIGMNEQLNRISPPDTTTHSPRSPERPPSQKSGGSDMVQCVSSSEPDSVVSPSNIDSSQSPTQADCDRGVSYQNAIDNYKPSEPKMRRVKTPPNFNIQDIKPDSHEAENLILN